MSTTRERALAAVEEALLMGAASHHHRAENIVSAIEAAEVSLISVADLPSERTEPTARTRRLPVKASCAGGYHQGCASVGVVALCGCACHPRAHREVPGGPE